MTGYEDVFRANAHEGKDCVVQAVSKATGVSYLHAHHAMEVAGRAKVQGTAFETAKAALDFLGWTVVRIWTKQDLALEMRVKKPTLADLEGKDWLPRLLVVVNKHDHTAPFVDGHVRDWSVNTEASIDEAWEIQRYGITPRRKPAPVIYL